MVILKTNFLILLLLLLENVYDVKSAPDNIDFVQSTARKRCWENLKYAYGENKNVKKILIRILNESHKQSMNMDSNEDFVQYFKYIRDSVNLNLIKSVQEFCDSYNGQQPNDDFKNTYNIDRNISKRDVFNLFFEKIDAKSLNRGSYTGQFFSHVIADIRLEGFVYNPYSWCYSNY